MRKELTPRQREILEFVKEFLSESGYPPSLRDICGRFGIKGPKNAGKHLDALERKGFLRRGAGARAIELLERRPPDALSIPIAGQVRAGEPHLAIEDILGHVVLDPGFFRCRGAFLLKVVGQSMTGAGIEDGDFVVVRPQPEAAPGDIVVAMTEGEATVKRFLRDGDAVVLKPENPLMEPIRVEGGEFSIIGKVVSVIRRIET